jgi:hypothetical protein
MVCAEGDGKTRAGVVSSQMVTPVTLARRWYLSTRQYYVTSQEYKLKN